MQQNPRLESIGFETKKAADSQVALPNKKIAKRLTDWAALAMVWLLVDFSLFIFAPLLLSKGPSAPWQNGDNLAFLSLSACLGVAGGIALCVRAKKNAASSWWFLCGHAGAFVAPFVAPAGMLGVTASTSFAIVIAVTFVAVLVGWRLMPKNDGKPADDVVLRMLSRALYMVGDIKLGIALMVGLVVALFWGTWWESWYGLKSAHHVFYTSWWFGLLLLGFGISLVSATLRKFPWRLDQTGWIVVHISLVLILVGSFMTFWGKQEGELGFGEGDTVSQFASSTQTQLEVREATSRNGGRRIKRMIWQAETTFDRDPRCTEPEEKFQVADHGLRLFDLVVDRYYSDGKEKVLSDDSAATPKLAVMGELVAPGGGLVPFELVAADPGRAQTEIGGLLRLQIMDGINESTADSLRRQGDAESVGKIVVLNGDSVEVVSVALGSVPVDIDIPGQDSSLRVLRKFDTLRVGGPKRWYDASPGQPTNPAIEYSWTKNDAKPSLAFAWQPGFSVHSGTQAKSEGTLNVQYKLDTGYPLPPRTFVIARSAQGEPFWVYQGSEMNDRISGMVVAGGAAELAPGMKIEFAKVHKFHSERRIFERKSYRSRNQVARVRVEIDGKTERELWLPLGLASPTIRVGNRNFELTWAKATHSLGFLLRLDDFRRKFYPGSAQERAFESDVTVFEPGDRHGNAMKIDMNHPLRYQGWRLYQSRFSTKGGDRSYLSVNRDPGLLVTWPACGLLFLGLIIVFFQKPFLRQVAKGTNGIKTSKRRRVLAACIVVLAGFAAVIPGVALMLALGEGGIVLVGIFAVVAGLWLETLWLNGPLARRLASPARQAEVNS